MTAEIQFIGKINSPLLRIEDCPLQENENAPEASISIYSEYAEGIRDIRTGAEVLILTWLHRGDRSVLKTQPRNNREAPFIGVFSTRSPDRPNPVGIHKVKVLSVSMDGLIKVSGLEVLDQTPVIDIKPVWNE